MNAQKILDTVRRIAQHPETRRIAYAVYVGWDAYRRGGPDNQTA